MRGGHSYLGGIYDVTLCFEGNQMAHKMIRLGYVPEMDFYKNRPSMEAVVRNQIAQSGGCTEFRVQRLHMFIKESESALYVIFTIVDFPEVKNQHPDMPPAATLKTAAVIQNLQNAIKDGFTVNFDAPNGKYLSEHGG